MEGDWGGRMVGVRPGAGARGIEQDAPRPGGPGLAARPAEFAPRALDHPGRRPGAGPTAEAHGTLESRDGRQSHLADRAESEGKDAMTRWTGHRGPPRRIVDGASRWR